MSNAVPPLLTTLVDDAAVFPPGSATLADAIPAHEAHRQSWYAQLIGPLLVPVADREAVPPGTAIGLIGEPPPDLAPSVRQVECPVAKRGEDPLPGIERMAPLIRKNGMLQWYLEVPLAWGLMTGLDAIAALRGDGLPVAAKFRTGGLAAELFPTPVELAAVICACRDRDLPFKLTAGLHHAVRHTDAETGLVHHGFLNILAAVLAAVDSAEPGDLALLLASTEGHPLADLVRPQLHRERPLWVGFGSCSVQDPVGDLVTLGLLDRPVAA
ncbi:hypothetical protein Dvina_01295 [Dactylosporangium vinaceum]|uniref:Uroporphyrinogen decarboxylase (URO-D) domain-containing protein n=1 Tax=Dactylosporangium vinaceum TaxID=53362 RepID=A0ABV5MLQ4_9ACTN|nr:hypothetical protein [Dactylosporangium vinaceum]UAB96893.1 hypothetical protein Dvina_01295 [Dactylosporangium vinaceum]